MRGRLSLIPGKVNQIVLSVTMNDVGKVNGKFGLFGNFQTSYVGEETISDVKQTQDIVIQADLAGPVQDTKDTSQISCQGKLEVCRGLCGNGTCLPVGMRVFDRCGIMLCLPRAD
jgi:hypothetical protein